MNKQQLIESRTVYAEIGGKKIRVRNGLLDSYEQITNQDEAISLGNAMAKTGNYPAGMSPCFVAGINGDQTGEKCIFNGKDFCTCEVSK